MKKRSRPIEWTLEIFPDVMRVSRRFGVVAGPSEPLQSGGGVRGKIKGFSAQSRRRFMFKLHSIRDFSGAHFVTLTYPDQFPDQPERWKRDLHTFKKRLRRRFPEAKGLWRIELKRRKSGENAGKVAPHYHLIVTGIACDVLAFRAWVKENWYQVVGSHDERHFRAGTQVNAIENRRHAAAYASKYATKSEDEDIELEIGRHWGVFGFSKEDFEPLLKTRVTWREGREFRRMVSRFLNSKGAKHWSQRVAAGRTGFMVFGLGLRSHESWRILGHSTVGKMVTFVSTRFREPVRPDVHWREKWGLLGEYK